MPLTVTMEPLEPGQETLAPELAAGLEDELAVTTVVLTTVVVAIDWEEAPAEEAIIEEDEDTGTDAILAPQTPPLDLGAPTPLFK